MSTPKITSGKFSIEPATLNKKRISLFSSDSNSEVATIWAGGNIDQEEAEANAEFVKECFDLAQVHDAKTWKHKLDMHDSLVDTLKQMTNAYCLNLNEDGSPKLSFDELLLLCEGVQKLISSAEKLK